MLRMTSDLHQDHGRQVVALEAEALRQLTEMINASFAAAVEAFLACKQRVVVSGMGKSGHIARKVAATLAATGTPAHFVHGAEAAHGDAGMIMPDDVLLVFSNSGDTAEMQPLYAHAKRIGVQLVGVSRNRDSLLMRNADIGLLLPQVAEACTASMAPTTSSTMMLALGDALAVATMRARGLSGDDIRALHPGGDIGRRMSQVADVMHSGDRLPLVTIDTPMPQVLMTMSEKRLGMTGVIDASGDLVGVITDGDLRRHMTDLATGTVTAMMTPSPKIIEQTASVDDALELMRAHRVSVLFVVPESNSLQPVGAVQIYDIAATPPWGR
jgi:arabinose-5-phosphate isomerase